MANGILYLPAGSVGDAHIDATDPLSTSKTIHRYVAASRQDAGTNVVAKTDLCYIARANGTISAFKVGIITAPDGGNLLYTVDLKKSTGGGAFATILSAVVSVADANTNNSVVTGSLTTATYAAGDLFEIVVAVSGSTGSQGQGMMAEVVFEE